MAGGIVLVVRWQVLSAVESVMTVVSGGAGTGAEGWCSSLTSFPNLPVVGKEEG
jgi:hypothetical protein